MRRALRFTFIMLAIAIFLSTAFVSMARRTVPEIHWLYYWSDDTLFRKDLNRGDLQRVTQLNIAEISRPTWTANGRWLIYERGNNLYRLDFSGHRVERLTSFSTNGDPILWQAWRDWFLIYDGERLYKMREEGGELQQLGAVPYVAMFEDVSHDGQKILFSTVDGENEDLYVLEAQTDRIRQLTNDEGREYIGQWSLGDEWVVFLSNQGADRQFFQIRPDGSDLQPLDPLVRLQTFGHISPDEQWILVDYEYPVGLYRSDGSHFDPLTQIPNLGNTELFVVWGADSNGFITAAEVEGNEDVQEFYWNSVDGSERRLVENSTLSRHGFFQVETWMFSPDRTVIVDEVPFDPSTTDIRLVLLPTNGDPVRYLTSEQALFEAWSSDGEWIVAQMAFGDSRYRNELVRIFVADGRIERLTFTEAVEERYLGMAPIVDLNWSWKVTSFFGLVALVASVRPIIVGIRHSNNVVQGY